MKGMNLQRFAEGGDAAAVVSVAVTAGAAEAKADQAQEQVTEVQEQVDQLQEQQQQLAQSIERLWNETFQSVTFGYVDSQLQGMREENAALRQLVEDQAAEIDQLREEVQACKQSPAQSQADGSPTESPVPEEAAISVDSPALPERKKGFLASLLLTPR